MTTDKSVRLETRFRSFLPWLLVIVLAVPLLQMQFETAVRKQQNNLRSDGDPLLLLSSSVPSFGNRNLMADTLWLRFVQYFGDVASREKTSYELNYQYLNAITDSNPQFAKPYYMSNLAIAYKMGRTDLAEALLLKGIRHNPDDHTIWQMRGYLHYLYTGNVPEAIYSFRKSAGVAVAKHGNAGQWYGNYWLSMSKYLGVSKNNAWTRRGIWKEVYLNASDDETRNMALEQLKPLGVTLQPDGQLKELYPLYPPKGFAKQFTYGPPYPYHR